MANSQGDHVQIAVASSMASRAENRRTLDLMWDSSNPARRGGATAVLIRRRKCWMMATEGRRRHPVGLFDAPAKAVFVAAQRDAERRGGRS